MPYRMKVDQPNLAKGEEVLIPGLGAFANGETHDITDEQAETYRQRNAVLEDVLDSKGQRTGRATSKPGPPLIDVNVHGITVEHVEEARQASSKPQPNNKTGNVKVTPNNGGGE